MIKDHIMISRKIYLINLMKISRLTFQTMFIAYFISQYWFVFIYATYSLSVENNLDRLMCERHISFNYLSPAEASQLDTIDYKGKTYHCQGHINQIFDVHDPENDSFYRNTDWDFRD